MKGNGKSSKPIIAAHTKKNTAKKPAPPPNEKTRGDRRWVSRVPPEETRALVLDRISDAILGFDTELKHVYVNERAGEILGCEPGDLLGKKFWDVYPESTASAFADACQRAIDTQTVVPFDGYFPSSESRMRGRVYPAPDGISVLFTEQPAGPAAIHDFSTLPEQNPNPVMRFTPDGEILYANSVAAPLLAFWKDQSDQTVPSHFYGLLKSAFETDTNQETEIEFQGRVFASQLVPLREAGYVNVYSGDITEHLQAEQSLRALVHQSAAGITRIDLEGRFTFVNQAFCDMLGYAEQELIGKTIWSVTYPEDIVRNRQMLENLASSGEAYQLEKRLLRRNGSTIWVSVATSPLQDAAGHIQAATSIIVNITRRKRAEESLMDSARRTLYLASLSDVIRALSSPARIQAEAAHILGTHLKASRVAYVEIQQDGQASISNHYSSGIQGFPPAFDLHAWIPARLLAKLEAGRALVAANLNNEPGYPEANLESPAGESVQAQIIVPLLREEKLVAALIVQQVQPREWDMEEVHLVQETAERMQAAIERARAERELQESEKRFRLLANTVPSMVWSTSPDGTIQYVNDYWIQYTGMDLERAVASWTELLHPDDHDRCLAAWNHALETAANEFLFEVRYRGRDGAYRWFQSRAVPGRDEHGNVTGWYGVTTDIHDRHEREWELQAIINRTPFMFTRCTRDLRYQFVSRAYAEMIGRTPEEIAGKPIVEIMGEEGLRTIRPYVEQVLQGQRVEYESQVAFQDIKTPFLHVVYVPDYDEHGNISGWFASITDMTEHRLVEEERSELLQREQEQRLAAELAKGEAEQAKHKAEQELHDRELAEQALGHWADESLPQESRPMWLRYAVAFLATAAAVVVRVLLTPVVGEFVPFSTLYGAIAFSVWYGGVGPSLLATTLGFFAAEWFVIKPQFAFSTFSIGNVVGVGLYLFSSVIIIALGYAMRRAQRHAHQSAGVAVERQRLAQTRLVEQKRVEEALRESERKFSLIYDRLPFVAALGRWEDLVLVDANKEFERVFGYSRDEIQGRTSLELGINPDAESRQRIRELIQRDGFAHDIEATLVTRSGEERLFLANIDIVTIGETKYLLNTLQDITERKQKENEIRRLNAELQSQLDETRALLEILPIGVWIGNHDASVITGNQAAYEMLGLPVGINASVTSSTPEARAELGLFVNGEPVTPENAPMQRVARTGQPMYDFEHEIAVPNGKRTLVYASVVPVFDEQGRVRKVIGAYTDVTERKRAEERLRTSEERFRALVSQSMAGIAQSDAEGCFIFVNSRLAEMLGYSEGELLGKTIWDLTYREDVEENKRLFTRMMAEGQPYQLEKRFIRKDGSLLWSGVSVTSIYDADGKPTGGVGVMLDIEERKRSEQALIEYARQQAALYGLTDQLQQAQTEEEIHSAALNAILNALQCPRASILLFDDTNVMHFVAWRGLSADYRRATDGHSPWQHDAKNAEPIYYNNVDESDLSDALKAVIKKEGIAALAFIPLVSNGHLIGKFMVYFNEPHSFDEAELDLSLTIAHQLASSIDRKRAEQALRESEESYRRIVETANEGIWEIDSNALTVFVNARMAEMLGYTVEEMIGRSAFDFRFAEDRAEDEQLLVRARQGAGSRSSESRFRRKDDSVLWALISTSPQIDGEGNFVGSIAMITDITERKRAEEALRASESLYRTIARSIPGGGIYVIDKNFRYVVAEGPVTEAFGFSREQLEGHTVSEIFSTVSAERMVARLRQNFAGETVSFETERNGRFYWTQQAPLLDSFGQAIIVTLDITERKQMEKALRQSEQRFAQFMKYLPGLAWIKDVQGRYVYANDAAEKAFHTPREKLYGQTDADLFPPELAGPFQHNDEQAMLEVNGIQVVEQLPQQDGVVHYSLVTKFPIPGPDGTIAMIGGTAFDITERIRMEVALQQAHQHAEENAQRMARLQEVTAAMAASVTPAQLAEIILEQGTRATGSNASILVELINDGKEIKTIAALGYPPSAMQAGPVPLDVRTPMSDCIRTRRAIWIESHEEFAAQYPELAQLRGSVGNEATVALPLIAGDHVLGGLTFSFEEKREFLLEERGFLLTVAQQSAQALERTRAIESLRESEERYRAIVNQATAGIVRKDPGGRLLYVNEAFAEMLGYRPADLVGRTIWELTHEGDMLENKRLYNRLMMEGMPFHLEKRMLDQNGSTLWTAVSVSPVLDASGKTESAVSVYVDITERKQTEEALNDSRERYRNLFNLVPVAVYTTDAEGLIQEYNRSAVELWGREPFLNDPSDRYCGSFKTYYPDGRFMPHRTCPMARMLHGETLDPSELELVIERRDGSRRNAIAHPLILKNERGEVVGAINCLYDITDRKEAEKRLALLGEVNEMARKYEDPDQLMHAVAQAVGEYLNVQRCLFNEIDLQNDREIVHSDYHNGAPSVAGQHKLTEYSSITTAQMEAGTTIVNHDSKVDPRTAEDYERSYLPTGERAYVAVPLMREGRWVASLWVSDDAPHQWSDEDVSLLETIADRTWSATEKLRIHAALRESQQRLALTYEHAPIGIVETSLDGDYVRVNEEFCQIVGYEKNEILQLNIRDLTYAEDQQIDMEPYRQLIDGEISFYRVEKRYVTKGGSLIWAQVVRSIIRDGHGTPLYSIGAILDVSERKRAEEDLRRWSIELEERVQERTAELETANKSLRESEAISRLILESMPDAIVITDADGRIVYCNEQTHTLFGYLPAEILGRSVEMLIPERFRQAHNRHRTTFQNDRSRRLMGLGSDLWGLRRDNTEFPVDVTLSPISNNTPWDIMVTIRDTTEQRRAQEALRINEEKLRRLFEIVPVGISFLGNNGQLLEMNTALTQILGLTKSELQMGKHRSRHYVRSDGSPMPEDEFASVRAHREQRPILNVETGILQETGEIIWTSVNAAPVQVADVDVVVATIDITERKKAEDALHKNRESLRVLSRRLVEVQEDERRAIARELHDRVGQNLAALNLNLNILRSQLTGPALVQIGSRISDSVNLVNQILTITRNVMADLRSNVLDDYGLEAALREYADQFMQRTGVRVVTDKSASSFPRLPSSIEMTLLRIAQEALTNVARHAQATQATISLRMDDDAVHMSVQDDGIGILSWQKANQGGSHGLRIIRERAEAFGGTVQLHSAYKKGTRMEVEIPLERNTAQKRP